MPAIDTVTITKFYTIESDLEYSEVNSFESAVAKESKFIIRQEIGNNPYYAADGKVVRFYASTLELLDKDGKVIKFLEENDWKFSFSRFGQRSGNSFTDMWIKYTDKFGFENSLESFEISIEGFISAYKRFNELNTYDGYRFAKVATENSDLKKQVLDLNTKVTALEADNTRLKTILSSMS
jgi:hypothetical protein